jgi:hypothetical protein
MVDTDTDRYPTLNDVMRRIVAEAEVGDSPVERIEINLFANGDATYRSWAPHADEPEGGFVAGPER